MQICEFGCGKEATHHFKSSGKWCCSSNVNACEGKKKKDSELKKGINPWKNKKHPKGKLGKKSWNSGKTYENVLGKEEADNYKNKISSALLGRNGHSQTEKTKKIISDKMKIVGGGYRKGSGRGKCGWYREIWCDSSWELAYVIFCIDNNIKIKRNTEKRNYIWKNELHTYIPDFIVNNEIVEIKGYVTEQWKSKLEYNNDIKVIGEEEIKFYLDYVINKYGKDFIKMYTEGRSRKVLSRS